jgi:predicted nucleic acid-binding protein
MQELSYVRVEADKQQPDNLDPGESAALTVANKRDAVLLTDDLAARTAATDRGIEVRGSLGVIAFGYAKGELDRDEAASRMRELQHETSLFVTDAVVERGIDILDRH